MNKDVKVFVIGLVAIVAIIAIADFSKINIEAAYKGIKLMVKLDK